jgi:hypothetical protein
MRYVHIYTHTHIMKYYSAINKDEIKLFAEKGMEPEKFMLS